MAEPSGGLGVDREGPKGAANENDARTTHVHVFPVDPALTVDEAWDELCLMGARATNTGKPSWASIRCDGDECRNIAVAAR